MAALSVYIDDSGTHSDSAIVVAAGYVAELARWESFSQSWQKLLAEAGVPVGPFGVRVFHMKDFAHSHTDPQSPFYSWREQQKADFMARATALMRGIAAEGAGAGITIGIIVRDYLNTLARLPRPAKPFTFALIRAMVCVEDWVKRCGKNEPVTYFFDRVPQHAGEGTSVMQEVEEDIELSTRLRFSRWSWSSKDRDSPLQAADILAYESYKEGEAILAGGEKDQRRSLTALAPSVTYHTLFDQKTLDEFIQAPES